MDFIFLKAHQHSRVSAHNTSGLMHLTSHPCPLMEILTMETDADLYLNTTLATFDL